MMRGLEAISMNPRKREHPEYGFIGVFTFLAILGFMAMWSASSGYAVRTGKTADYFARRQIAFLLLGSFVFFVCYRIPLSTLRSRTGLLTLAALIFLATPLIPGLGVEINGARRWVNLYVTNFQPSEIWKPFIVFYAAHIFDKRADKLKNSAGEAAFPLLVVIIGVLLIYLQNDFSTAALALVAPLSVFWLAGVSLLFFAAIGIPALLSIIIMVASSEYRLARVIGFIIPEFDPHGMNYQVQNSLKAIISGGFFGKGLGLGTRKIASIPEIQSDFVFAGFVEEMGLAGVIAIVACWIFIIVTVIAAVREKEGFEYLLPLGLLFLLFIQFFINLGVVAGFLPATGIALPFFSAGGSSLLSTALAGGLMANAMRTKSHGAGSEGVGDV
jgi:cell division protein FtsW